MGGISADHGDVFDVVIVTIIILLFFIFFIIRQFPLFSLIVSKCNLIQLPAADREALHMARSAIKVLTAK